MEGNKDRGERGRQGERNEDISKREQMAAVKRIPPE